MPQVRNIKKIRKSKPTIEGAGGHLKRAFGYYQVPQLDPFLMLDDFHSGKPLAEPVAWYGPIVMNTEAGLKVAFDEYQRGAFIKHNAG